MPIDGYENLTVTEHARDRLRELRTLLMQSGAPDGIKVSATSGWTVSAVLEIAVATTEREIKKKRRKK